MCRTINQDFRKSIDEANSGETLKHTRSWTKFSALVAIVLRGGHIYLTPNVLSASAHENDYIHALMCARGHNQIYRENKHMYLLTLATTTTYIHA